MKSALFIALISLGFGVAAQGMENAIDPARIRVSTVSDNGMPCDIVKPGHRWNFGPGALWTHKGWQYAAYWDDARQVSVGRRKLPDGRWAVVSLPGYQRSADGDRGKGGSISRGFGDSHEKVAMGISPDGVIHLSFDHHLSTLRYRTSILPVADAPESHTWTAELFGPVRNHLGGPPIESVTYPSFYTDGSRFLLYLRLGGGSGSANSHFFTYENHAWTINTEEASKFIDREWSGGDKTVNAYPLPATFHNGRLHLAWCWRDTPDSKTCHDLCYAYSDDGGKTWMDNQGRLAAVTGSRFISADTPDIAAWKIPTGTSYVNGGSMTVDQDGRVHVLMRGEYGSPVHFQRDPATARWMREKATALGSLVTGPGDKLHLLSENGVYNAPTSDFGKMTKVVSGMNSFFKDCKPAMDATRIHDGWVSLIGQSGKTVTVVDYQIAD
jgi:hypothetical protein